MEFVVGRLSEADFESTVNPRNSMVVEGLMINFSKFRRKPKLSRSSTVKQM